VYALVVGNDLLFAGTQVIFFFLGHGLSLKFYWFSCSHHILSTIIFNVGKYLVHPIRDFVCIIHTLT
jgi:hypothetical protein